MYDHTDRPLRAVPVREVRAVHAELSPELRAGMLALAGRLAQIGAQQSAALSLLCSRLGARWRASADAMLLAQQPDRTLRLVVNNRPMSEALADAMRRHPSNPFRQGAN